LKRSSARVRLVFLGAAGVGKTSLIRRFLLDTFEPQYRRTVDELYCFPAMRKLSIQNSDAF
uniref:Uncharacterized protein n=1 Tax=Callorhinchus milii TaxID=7868 RepID=A0A4W3GS11_CALMI